MQKTERLYSLDALRGFDMLWISGGAGIIKGLSVVTGWGIFIWLEQQMHHVPWEGFTFYDMIFPLFLFMAGVSFPYSVASRLEKGQKKSEIYRHMFNRLFLLILLGCIYNDLLVFNFENMRYASVLGRIGIAWFFAAVIYLSFRIKWQIVWFWGLLLAYWAAMMFIPVPGYGAGILTLEGNLAAYIDRLFLPGLKLFNGFMDPEGILSNFPAISTALLGIFAGHFLKDEKLKFSKQKKAGVLLIGGIFCWGMGALWGLFFPIIKNLWTSSYVLFAGGLSLSLLAIFYFVIDVLGFKKLGFPFAVIGLNSITIYLIQKGIINFYSMRDFFFTGIINQFTENWQVLVGWIGYVLCVWVFMYFLYWKRIFLKV